MASIRELIADFSGCFSLQCLSCSLILVWMLHFVVPIYTCAQLQGIRYTPAVVRGCLLSFADCNICCIFVVGLNTVCRLCFFKSFPLVVCDPFDVRQKYFICGWLFFFFSLVLFSWFDGSCDFIFGVAICL